ncbi:MAG: VanZ family protein [Bacteroidales bacterium]|nr:VanZ family protein [Bacteroidales bacterium]
MERYLRLYRTVFWTGYVAVLITTFLPISFRVDKITFGPDAFAIRSDHLLHFAVYLLICLFYLLGAKKGLKLFDVNPLRKFIVLILLLATVTELAQLWVPDRAFNVFDGVANLAGVLAGWGVIKIGKA